MTVTLKTKLKLCAAGAVVCLPQLVTAEPKYSADVPEFVMTPDVVETSTLGRLEFFDGMPKPDTVQKVFDNLDLVRGTAAFLDGIPITSLYALNRGLRDLGVEPGEIGISETLLNARSLFLTPNTTTIYIFSQLDLSDGPVVVDAPPGLLGLINDAGFRYVADIGQAGPDKGEGGKYLFLPPGYEGDVPDGYFVFQSATFDNWAGLRAAVKDGDTETPVNAVKEHLNIYPLALADNPPPEIFHNMSDVQFNTIHANDFHFFEELNDVIQKEPAAAFSPELTGTFAAVGIKKGLPFKPDARMKGILTEAAAIGNATARALTFNPRRDSAFAYEERNWTVPFAGGSYEWMDNGERVKDHRTFFHYMATGITPAMISTSVGKGSAYITASVDTAGDYLDGGKTYTVTLPTPVPVANFWSFMVYSGQHRSILETDQKTGGVDSNSPDLKANDDGTYTIWFGPKAPVGHKGNWVQTLPGKSFFTMFRLYGPLESWMDKSWKIGDFEQVAD